MASIDKAAFAYAVAGRLERLGLSARKAAEAFPETDAALWSRIRNGKTILPGNYMLVCRLLKLSPWKFLVRDKRMTRKTLLNRAVTRGVSRETTT